MAQTSQWFRSSTDREHACADSAATAHAGRFSKLRLAMHPLLRDLLLTLATEFGILVVGLVLVSLFGRLLGPTSLGEYLLVRRVTSWLITGGLLGMGNAIPRYIAHSAGKSEADCRVYFLAGSICLLGSAGGLEIAFYVGRKWFAYWLFGSAQFTYLILPLGLLFAGLALQTAVYGYYRGILDLRRANLMQFLHFAIIPLGAVALLYRTQSVAFILDITGGLTLVAAAVFAWPICKELVRDGFGEVKPRALELLRYGVARVPGNFGIGALLALGPLVAAHYVSMTRVGYLLLGANFLMVMGYTTGPVGILLLSKLSSLLGQNRIGAARSSLVHLVGAVLDISIFAAVQLAIFADVLIRAWVGTRYLDALTVTRLLLLAVPPYLLFIALRSCIDAATVKACNTTNVLISLVVFALLTVATIKMLPLNDLLNGLALSLVAALVVLGFLSARTFRQLYGVSVPLKQYGTSLALGLLLGAFSYGFRQLVSFQHGYLVAALFEIAIIAAFLRILTKLKSPWLRFLLQMTISNLATAGTPPSGRAV